MKTAARTKMNMIFSCFLVIGYIVCSYFFSTMAGQVAGVLGTLLKALILVLFGLLLFWSTRVGEGKQVKRFSLAVLLLIVLPCVYIIAAGLVEGLPLHDVIAPADGSMPILMILASVGLGYGIPYTFVAGYEIADDEEETDVEEIAPLEGGLAEELAQAEAEAAKEAEEAFEEAEEEADVESEIQEIEE